MAEPDSNTTHLSVPWRGVAIGAVCLALGIVTALIIVATIQDAGALGTIALVLAVVAFVSQLMIFVAQLAFTSSQLQQAERINSATSAVLADVSSRVARLDETQLQQFTEIREQLLPRALGEQMVNTIDRTVDDVAKQDPRLASLVEEALEGLRSTIESKTEREYSTETVQCLFCPNRSVAVRLGSVPGDSAFGECHQCGNRFHVHRDRDGRVFAVRPGGTQSPSHPQSNDPEEILRGHQMQLPDAGARRRLIAKLVDEWKAGRISKGSDVTAWMDYPSRVRTPFFFAMANLIYGQLKLTGPENTRAADRDVSPVPSDFDESAWMEAAHAAWIAQALYRLRAWRRTGVEELGFFFGPEATADDQRILDRARNYDLQVQSLAEDSHATAQSRPGAEGLDEEQPNERGPSWRGDAPCGESRPNSGDEHAE